MNTDIIDMAREVGITQAVSRDQNVGTFTLLERFATLVADARLEQAAEVLEHAGEFAAAEVVRGLKS